LFVLIKKKYEIGIIFLNKLHLVSIKLPDIVTLEIEKKVEDSTFDDAHERKKL
jgi:hypothetical protein